MIDLRYSRWLGAVPSAQTPAWALIGQDGGQSIDVGGASLFVFSDTLLAPLQPHGGEPPPFPVTADGPCLFLGNCAAVGSGNALQQALGGMRYFCDDDGFPVEVIPSTAAERAAGLRFWPEHGIHVDGQVYLYYLGIESTGSSSVWDFRNTGVGLATVDVGSGVCERILRDGDWRLWRPIGDDFHLGVQVVAEGGHIYVFGSRRHGVVTDAVLARVERHRIADATAYAYLDAMGGWVGDARAAASLGACAGDYSVSFNPYLGRYLMAFVDGYAKKLLLRVADRLEGPYSDAVVVGRLPHRSASELLYCGFEHPQYAGDGGRRVYVSYSEPAFSRNSLLEVCFS